MDLTLISQGSDYDFVSATQSSDKVSRDIFFRGNINKILSESPGIDAILLQGGDDIVFDDENSRMYFGNLGNDNLSGQDGNDTLLSGQGFDFISGGNGDDLLAGNFDGDTLTGDDGNDTIYGGKGNDVTTGGLGDDFLFGDAGDDILLSKGGYDVMSGGAGADDFVVGEDSYFSDSQVYIQDFNSSEGDRIVISDLSLDQVGFEETIDGVVFYELDTDFSFVLVAGVSFAQIQNSLVSAYDNPSINLAQSIDISGDWTYRATTFSSDMTISSEEYESVVSAAQNDSSFFSEGGYTLPSIRRGEPEYEAIGSGFVIGNKVLSFTNGLFWSGVISEDRKTITGTAAYFSRPEVNFDFVMTRDGSGETPTPTPTPSTGAFEQQVFVLINQERAKAGLQPLSFDTRLAQAAETHSQNMAVQDFFSHIGADGSVPEDRIEATGFELTGAVAENIAAMPTPEEAVIGWMNSTGHRNNILDPEVTKTGVGYYYLGNDTGDVNYNHYWTQVFSS